MSTENSNVNVPGVTPADNKGDQKTFTQEQMNAIISDRLARDRQKQNEEMSKREQELAQRELRLNNRQKLLDRGYPEIIMDALNCSSEEAFNKALDLIDGLIKERTPSKEQAELEKNRARFTAPMNGLASAGREDPIRKAMNINA